MLHELAGPVIKMSASLAQNLLLPLGLRVVDFVVDAEIKKKKKILRQGATSRARITLVMSK